MRLATKCLLIQNVALTYPSKFTLQQNFSWFKIYTTFYLDLLRFLDMVNIKKKKKKKSSSSRPKKGKKSHLYLFSERLGSRIELLAAPDMINLI